MQTTNLPGGEEETSIAQNPNPAANENLPINPDTDAEKNTAVAGSEITDGEDG